MIDWIDVKDNLPDPEDEREILCFASKFGEGIYGACHIGWYDYNKKAWMYYNFNKETEYEDNPDYWWVTHWAYINLPKTKEQ